MFTIPSHVTSFVNSNLDFSKKVTKLMASSGNRVMADFEKFPALDASFLTNYVKFGQDQMKKAAAEIAAMHTEVTTTVPAIYKELFEKSFQKVGAK